MGLDQYAYVASKAGERTKWYDNSTFDPVSGDYVNPDAHKPRELAYWRKHPNLHGWMRKLWEAKGGSGDFNGDELELTWEDLDMLEHDIKNGYMSNLGTTGFFFGEPSDDYYKEKDLKFIREAKAELICGLKVFYDSSW